MTMTPLFPDGPLKIKQGRTGNCYLLASLDSIYSSNDERKLLKSLFTQDETGVTLRIPHSSQSSFLSNKNLEKYKYHYDETTKEDVFFLSNKRLEEIDKFNEEGVITNSLAIKILERVSSYFYIRNWELEEQLNSTMAHNTKYPRHETTSTEFVGKLIGVHSNDTTDIENIIKLKTIFPDYPVYISMIYGNLDGYGNTHGRHALRIDKIVPASVNEGGYKFILVNPWDNQKREEFNLSDIKKRKFRFCTFSSNEHKHNLVREMLKLPDENGVYVSKNPELQAILLKMQEKKSLNCGTIKNCIDLYQVIKDFSFENEFTIISNAQRDFLIAKLTKKYEAVFTPNLLPYETNPSIFRNMLSKKIVELEDSIHAHNNAIKAADYEIQKNIGDIEKFEADFNDPDYIEKFNKLAAIQTITKEEKKLGLTKKHPKIVEAYTNKRTQIENKYQLEINRKMEKILNFSIDFSDCYTEEELRKKSTVVTKELRDLAIPNGYLQQKNKALIKKANEARLKREEEIKEENLKFSQEEEHFKPYLKKISEFAIEFQNITSVEAIRDQAKDLCAKLEEFNSVTSMNQAFHSSSQTTKCKILVKEAVEKRKNEVEQAAKKLEDKILIQKIVHEIQYIEVNFYNCSSPEVCDKTELDYIARINDLAKFDPQNPQIVQAVEQKIKNIDESKKNYIFNVNELKERLQNFPIDFSTNESLEIQLSLLRNKVENLPSWASLNKDILKEKKETLQRIYLAFDQAGKIKNLAERVKISSSLSSLSTLAVTVAALEYEITKDLMPKKAMMSACSSVKKEITLRAKNEIEKAIETIQQFRIDFSNCSSIEDCNRSGNCNILEKNARIISGQIEIILKLNNIKLETSQEYLQLHQAYDMSKAQIQSDKKKQIKSLNKAIIDILEPQLATFRTKTDAVASKNKPYKEAALIFWNSIDKALIEFSQGDSDNSQFKAQCEQAFEKVEPVFKEHRGLFRRILNFILKAIGVSNFGNNPSSFFGATDTYKKANALVEKIKELPDKPPV
ncbi:hypothetical protein [Legionella fairfieldensis]|uniref:hypothetical protein n=1 Tax=Legionella fairfieldensis TaxID=45064 RepID=UPI000685259A|nr:hypothetical protein [Legionella fairfieldensis]